VGSAQWTRINMGNVPTTSNNGIILRGGQLRSTISLAGPLNTCTQNIPLGYTAAHSFKGWNLIANPYASNIDWNSIISNNSSGIDDAVYTFDPDSNKLASYVNGVSTGRQSNVIENGAAFFVHSTGSTNLVIEETDKTTAAPIASLLKQKNGLSIIELSIGKKESNFNDNVILRWGGGYPATDKFDSKYDAFDFGIKEGLDLSVKGNDGTLYSIFHGSELKNNNLENRIVQLEVKKLEIGDYYISSKMLSSISGGNVAYLYDKYTNQYFNLINSCQDDCIYYFNVNGEIDSKSENRFSIIFNDVKPRQIDSEIITLCNKIAIGTQDFIIQSNSLFNKLRWELIDNLGRILKSGTFINVNKVSKYYIPGGFLTDGFYYIKLYENNKTLGILKAIKK
jgi:hypothetical protein